MDVGIIVSFDLSWFFHMLAIALNFCYCFSPYRSCGPNTFAYNIIKLFVQTSGSLYGALIGSIVAFSIADTIGLLSI